MDLLITQFIKKILLPPGGILILFTLAIVLHFLRIPAAKKFFLGGFIALFLLSTPLIADALMRNLEIYPALSLAQIKNNDRQAIVVLGGGAERQAAEYHGETVSVSSLLRVRYAAHLHGLTHLPVVTTGGVPKNLGHSEGFLMAEVLKNEYQVALVWMEEKSRNTAENALYTSEILNRLNIDKIFLVTQAWHMRRAVQVFENIGIQVTPAPTGFEGDDVRWEIDKFIPSADAFFTSVNALHEVIGYAWYAIRY